MSVRIWKILGIIGIVSLVLGLVFLALSLRGGNVYPTPGFASKPALLEIPTLGRKAGVKTETEVPTKAEAPVPSRMVIKTGWLNLVVKDISESIKKISEFANEHQGWVVSSNVYGLEKTPSGTITIRVPAEMFEEAMTFFKTLATRVSNEGVQSQDITEEYVDLQSRLKNLEAAENQLIEIMKRAGTISEVLETHQELTRVRGEIEKIKGKMQYLEQSVKMSSITVNLALSEELLPIPPSEKWRPKYVLLESWKNVVSFWKGFSYFLIRLFVWSQVWIPTLVILWLVHRVIKRKKRLD